MPATILVSLWANLGSRMIVFLPACEVPQELYDGSRWAGRWRKLVHVSADDLSHSIFNLIMGVIGSLKVFTVAFVATQVGLAGLLGFMHFTCLESLFSTLK